MTMYSVISPIEKEHEYVLEHVPVLHNDQVVAVGMKSSTLAMSCDEQGR